MKRKALNLQFTTSFTKILTRYY